MNREVMRTLSEQELNGEQKDDTHSSEEKNDSPVQQIETNKEQEVTFSTSINSLLIIFLDRSLSLVGLPNTKQQTIDCITFFEFRVAN